jgi:hypothetical protein
MAFLTRDQILNCDDIKTQEVSVPEWGGSVLVRGMTGTERDAFEASITSQQSGKSPAMRLDNIRAKLVQKSVADPTDNAKLMFTVADIELLGKKSAQALNRVFEVAQKLSGVGDDDVEEMVKNS